MAEVKAIPRNNVTPFIVNDASLSDLCSLEITEESSPKSDSDIGSLLRDNEINWMKQCFDKESDKQKKSDDNIFKLLCENNGVLTTKEKTAANSGMSLCALAKNHVENYKTLNEWNIGTDYCLSDLLCDGDGYRSENDKDLDHLNSFNIDLKFQSIPTKNKLPTTDFDVGDIDLSELVSGSTSEFNFRSTDSLSLDTLATSHACNGSGKQNSGKNFSDSFLFDLKTDVSDVLQFDSFADILSEKKGVSPSNSGNESLSDLSSFISSDTSDEKLSDGTSDDDIVPDIDLSFCIKKNVKGKFPDNKSTPDSVDSGFDEANFSREQFTSNTSETFFINPEIFGKYSDINGKEKFIKTKESVFSKALSARPKIDVEKCSKLKKIRCELIKKQISPFSFNSIEKQPKISDRLVNYTDGCITSYFLTISAE